MCVVFDAAIQKAMGKRKIQWKEVLAGGKASIKPAKDAGKLPWRLSGNIYCL